VISVPTLIAAKLALYEAAREASVSNVELGRRLGISEVAVRRLLDLDHRSHISQVEAGLQALGRRLVVDVQAA
jgi:antitoxin HicB